MGAFLSFGLALLGLGLAALNPTRAETTQSKSALKVIIDIPQIYNFQGQPVGMPGLNNNPDDGIDGEAHFHVLIENISSKPVYLWAESNSKGCRSLSLEITTASGQKIVLRNDWDSWTANVWWTQRLLPGESQVREVYYATNAAYLTFLHHPKPAWHSWGTFPFPDNAGKTVRVSAIFEQSSKWVGSSSAWAGRATSEPLTVGLGEPYGFEDK